MKRILITIAMMTGLIAASFAQQITVSPDNLNAYSQGATTVFLTYGGVTNKRPVDACWCGQIVSATPDVGFKCDPATVFGCLPLRYNQSAFSGNSAYTDIMSIPPSVARRAYVDAARGNQATFYYVRRFESTVGGRDEYVPVTIRLSGNGAAVPFSLTDVKLTWGVNKPILFVKPDEKLPRVTAEISYTGTGRLVGRWELVKPGEEAPTRRDLLTEATLPIEERGAQRKYTELSRFNVYMPPSGRFILPGPDVWRMPSKLEGMYLLLLRIEAVDDAHADSNLAEVGAGAAVVHSGAVAGFALPTLRYYVGSGGTAVTTDAQNGLTLLLPDDGQVVSSKAPVEFTWAEIEGAAYYRLEIEEATGKALLAAVALPGTPVYRAPSWLKDKAGDIALQWRVVAVSPDGKPLNASPTRRFRIAK